MQDLLVNGIDSDTGLPLIAGITLDDITRIAMGAPVDKTTLPDLYHQSRRPMRGQTRSPVEGVDAANLAQAGWGVVFASDADPAVREALSPLLALRRKQAGGRYRELTGTVQPTAGYYTGESKQDFLRRRGAATSGPVEPDRMPFYLLLVGSPAAIPFRFQYELDIQYGVGRIHFDNVDDYASYAAAVVAAESGAVTVEKRAAFVGVTNGGNAATMCSTEQLVKPLAAFLGKDQAAWNVESLIGEGAYKKDLLELLRRPQPPALLFTATHGSGYKFGHWCQYGYQGSLLMQDWGGKGAAPPELCFTKDDVGGLKTAGMICFHFACFGAGTPDKNQFFGYTTDEPGLKKDLAESPFMSALPKRMLANGALAAVGHVDTAFASTFALGASPAVFKSVLKKLAEGGRIGHAMDYFNLRHGELSVGLTTTIDAEQRENPAFREDLGSRWLQNNDARSYIVVGDPAVKLPLAQDRAGEAEQLTRRIRDMETELESLRGRLAKLSA